MFPDLVRENDQEVDLHPLLREIRSPERLVDTTEERAMVAVAELRFLSGIKYPSETVDVLRSATERVGYGVAGVRTP